MLRTIILDAYAKNEKEDIVDALDELCNPNDNYGWASAGIYCYWNYYSKEVYYIGLAVDLKERFKQHNGFYPSIDPNTCKKERIDKYFDSNEKLGFSIIVQSPLSQPLTQKVNNKYKEFFETWSPVDHYVGEDGRQEIKRQEGILLQAFKKAHGKLPKWNKMNGSMEGQKDSKLIHYESIRVLSSLRKHSLRSNSSLRELAEHPKFERYENFLHALRILQPMMGSKRALEYLRSPNLHDTYKEMKNAGYFSKELSF